MIKKARDLVGTLYDLERYEDVNDRLVYIRHLLADHSYLVHQDNREDLPEVC